MYTLNYCQNSYEKFSCNIESYVACTTRNWNVTEVRAILGQ